MKNEDDQCFKWCVARALNPVENHPERITKDLKKQAEKFDWSGIEFPVAADEKIISKFEKNNNISINVFGYSSYVYPMYVSKNQLLDDAKNQLINDAKHHSIDVVDAKHQSPIDQFDQRPGVVDLLLISDDVQSIIVG